MLRDRKAVQITILLVIALIGGYTLYTSLFDRNHIPATGSQAPEFALPGLDGSTLALSDYRGNVVIVNFWGTYCPPCVREMPLFERYYELYKDQDLIVLAVNENDSLISIKAFVRQHKLTFPVLIDRDIVRKQYGVTAYPDTFIVDRKGKIVAVRQGEVDEAFLRGALAKLIEL